MLPHKMVTGRVGDDKTFNSSALGLLNTPEIKGNTLTDFSIYEYISISYNSYFMR